MSKKPKTPMPWEIPTFEDADIFALQALANDPTHKRAWDFLREKVCGADTMSFWPGGEDGRRATDFAEGRRWVANIMKRLSNLKPTPKKQ